MWLLLLRSSKLSEQTLDIWAQSRKVFCGKAQTDLALAIMNVGDSIARHSLPSIAPSLCLLGLYRSMTDVELPFVRQLYED